MAFQAHIELLHGFLAHRDAIVGGIEGLLNAQRKPSDYLRDGARLSRRVEDAFFALAGVTEDQARLRGQLEDAHWARGFRPREIPGLHNGPADPAEMMVRAFYLWQQTRWPGRSGRIRYAHTLFNLYVVRYLELLSMRLWDDGASGAGDRLVQLQGVLDRLWSIKTADQPVLVKDARWLIQLAQSLATEALGPYFEVTERIETLPDGDRIEIHKAGVRMAAGHLRSQIRYYATKRAVRFDDDGVVLSTRTSNALDFALLIQELVPLLDAYEQACDRGHDQQRLELADAICQGVSPDPELFLNRVELLGAYSMIEQLFVTADDDGHATYTPMGRRHVRLLEEYGARIGRVATSLWDDCTRFRPVAGTYSPYGVIYGFSSDLIKHMVLKTSRPDAVTRFSLEDVFAAGDADTLAWVSGWRKLPHLTREMERQFDYPQQFAEDVFARIEQGLRRRASDGEANAVRTGHLFIVDENEPQADSKVAAIPELAARYFERGEARVSSDRREGRCLVSYETAGGWVAISKAVLTEVMGAGHDARIVGLPRAAAEALALLCPGLIDRPQSI